MSCTKLPTLDGLLNKSLVMEFKTGLALKVHDDYLQAYGYAALLGTGITRTPGWQHGKSHTWSILDDLSQHINPAPHELPVDELDIKLKAEWNKIQERKKLASSKSWRDKRKGFSGYYGGKR